MASLIQQYVELERKYKNLSQAYIELKTKNENLQKEYNELKKEVDELTCECVNKTCQYRIPNSPNLNEIVENEVNNDKVDSQHVDEIQDEQPVETIKETTKRKKKKDNNIKE